MTKKRSSNFTLDSLGFTGVSDNPAVKAFQAEQQANADASLFPVLSTGKIETTRGQYDASEYQDARDNGVELWGDSTNVEHQLGEGQSVGMQIGTAIARFAPMTVLKMVDQLHSLAGGVRQVTTGNKDWLSPDNAFNQYIQEVGDEFKRVLPIEATKKYDEGGFGDQMLSSKFWTDDAADGLQFLAAQVLGTKGMAGALGLVTKGSAAALNLAGAYKALPITERIAAAVANKFTTGTIGFLNTASNAAMQARDTGVQIADKLREQYGATINPNTGDYYTSEEIDQKVSQSKGIIDEKMNNTFWATAIVGLLPELYEARLILGGGKSAMGDLSSDIVKAVNGGKLTLSELEAGLGRDVLMKSGWKAAGKEAITAAAAEGLWEENMENAIQQYDVNQAIAGKTGGLWDSKYGYASEFLNNFTTKDGVKSIVLGALLGGAMGGIAGGTEQLERNSEMGHHLDSMQAADNLFGQAIRTIYKTDAADPNKLILDEDGQPIEDTEKLTKLMFQMLHHKENWDNQTAAILAGNKDMATLNENVALAQSITRELQSGRYESSDSAREYFKWFHGQRIKEQGMQAAKEAQDAEVKTSAAEQSSNPIEGAEASIKTASAMATGSAKSDAELSRVVNDNKQLVDTMFDLWDVSKKQTSRLSRIGQSENRQVFNDNVQRTLYYEAIKRDTLQRLIKEREQSLTELGANKEKTNKEMGTLSKLIQDSEQRSSDYLNKPDELFAEWDKMHGGRETLLNKASKADVAAKANRADAKLARNLNTRNYMLQENTAKEGIALGGFAGTAVDAQGNVITDRVNSPGTPHFQVNQDFPMRAATPVGLRSEFYYKAGNDYLKMQRLNTMMDKVRAGEATLSEAVDYANDNITFIDEETRGKLDALVGEERTKLAENEQKLAATPDWDDEAMAPNEEYALLEENINHRKDALTNSEQVLIRNKEQTELDKLNRMPGKIEQTLNLQFAEKNFSGANNVIANAFETDGTIKETYTDARSVEDAITKVTSMRNAVEDRITDGDWKGQDGYDYLIPKADEILAKLIAIRNAVQDNKLKREGVQRAIAQREAAQNISVLGYDLPTGSVINQPVYNIADTILKGKLGDMLKQLKELPSGNFYEGSMAILHAIKTNGTPEQMTTLSELIGERVAELTGGLPPLSTSKSVEQSFNKSPELYFDSYLRGMFEGQQSGYEEIPDDKNSALNKFRRDNDIDDLESRIAAMPDDTKDLGTDKSKVLALVRAYKELIAISRISNLLNSSVDLSKSVADEIKTAQDSTGIVPTAQQEISIRDGLAWLKSNKPVGNGKYSGWAYLRGIAGTGKTNVAVKWLLKLSGLQTGEVLVSAATDKAAAVIANSTGSEARTVQALLDESLPAGKRLLIIDEYARVTPDEMGALQDKIQEHNKNLPEGDRMRVLILGDPSQITPLAFANQDITNPVANRSAKNIRVLNPLTIVYRSEVSAVNETSDLFQDNPDNVDSINVRADRELGAPHAVGTHASKTGQDIVDIITANQEYERQNGLTPRSRVVIVSDMSRAKPYLALGVPVITVYDAQSETYDEAYVDLNKNDFSGVDKYNTAMYTGASRAREYSFLKFDNATNTVDPGLGREKENNDTAGREAKAEYIKARTEEQALMSAAVKGEAMSSPTVTPAPTVNQSPITKATEPEVEEETEIVGETPSVPVEQSLPADLEPEGSVDPDDETPVGPPQVMPGLPDTELRQLPNIEKGTFEALSPKDPRIGVGSRVVYMYTRENNGEDSVTAFAFDKDGNWYPVSKIFQEEISKLPQYAEWKQKIAGIKDPMHTTNPLQLNATGNKAAYSPEDFGPAMLGETRITGVQRLTYQFGNQPLQGGVVSHIRDMFKRLYYSPKPEEQAKADKIHFKIWRNNELQSHKFGGFTPEAGIPYAIVGVDAGSTDFRNAQFVRLTANKLNKNSEHYKVLKAYRDLAKVVEKETGIAPGTNDFVRTIESAKGGLDIVDNNTAEGQTKAVAINDKFNRETFLAELKKAGGSDPLSGLTDEEFERTLPNLLKIAHLLYGIQREDAMTTEAEMQKQYGDDYEFVPSKKSTNEAGEVLGRVLLKGTGGSTGRKAQFSSGYRLKRGKGAAQQAFDQLAKANEFVGNIRIRVEDMAARKASKGRSTVAKGKSLLSAGGDNAASFMPVKAVGNLLGEVRVAAGELDEADLRNDKIQSELRDEARAMSTDKGFTAMELSYELLNSSNLDGDAKARLIKSVEASLNVKETPPVTLDTLDMMVGDENYEGDEHTTSQAFNVKNPRSGMTKEVQTYLRQPLDIDQFNAAGKNASANEEALASMVGTKLINILPTQVMVGSPAPVSTSAEPTVVVPPVTPGSKSGIQSEIDDVAAQLLTAKGMAKIELLKRQKALRQQRDGMAFDETQRGDKGKKITLDVARKMITDMLPNISNEEMNFVTKNMMKEMEQPGESLLGLYEKGKIYFPTNELYDNVVRHEVFHKVFNDYMTDRDRRFVSQAFDPEGIMNVAELEETMADAFMVWRDEPKTFSGKIRRIFQKIADWLGFAKSNSQAMIQLFRNINEGRFLKPNPETANTRMAFSDVRKWGTVADYKRASEFLQQRIYDHFIDNNIDNMPLTQGELYSNLQQDLRDRLAELSAETDAWVEAGDELTTEFYAETDEEIKAELLKEADIAYAQVVENNQELLMLSNFTSSDSMLKDMWIDLYPSFNFKKEGIVSTWEEDAETNDPESTELDEETSQDKSSIAADFIQQSDERNNEGKVSQNVKNFLSFIYRPRKVGEKISRINPRGAYLQALRNLSGMQSSETNFIQQLEQRAAENGINLQGNTDAALVVRHIIDLYHNATSDRYEFTTGLKDNQGRQKRKEVKLSRDKRFVNDHTFVMSLTGEDLSEATVSELRPDKHLTIVRGNRSTADFLEEVAESGVSMEEAKGYFRQLQAQQTLAEVMSNFLSQRESTPMISEEVRGFKTVLKYFRAQNHGIERVKTAELEQAFKDNWSKLTHSDWEEFKNIKADNAGGQAKAIAALLKKLGVEGTDAISNVSSNTVITAYGDILAFSKVVDGIETDTAMAKAMAADVSDSDEAVFIDAVSTALTNNSGMLDRLTRILTLNSSDSRASSYTDTTGTKRYLFHNGSQAHETLNRITRFFGARIGSLPKHLTEDAVLSKNIFGANGVNRIYEILDHDGQRQEGKEEFATGYSGESNAQWLKRNFSDAFLTFMKTNARNNADPLTYMQNFYTISNRPRMIGARVEVLSEERIQQALLQAIEQHVTQPDLNEVKTYDRFKAVNFDELHKAIKDLWGFDIPALAKNTEGRIQAARHYADIAANPELKQVLAKQIITELKSQAEDTMDLMARENIALGSDVKDAMKLLKDKRRQILGDEDPMVESEITQKEGWPDKDQMRATVQSFYMNNYVNSFFLNQAVAGNMNFFKDGLDMIKRMSGVFAPGTKGMVGKFFMHQKFNVAVSADPKMKADMLSPIFNDTKLKDEMDAKGFDLADAQGFMLPERAENIVQGFGRAYNAGAVFKPAHYEIAERTAADGSKSYVPMMMKYSAVVLSDELVSRFPKLSSLRDEMRNKKVDEFIFDSADKVGAPAQQTRVPSAQDYDNYSMQIPETSIVQLSNENYRLQLNPTHDAYGHVSNPTQLSYFLNVMHKLSSGKAPNLANADKVYAAIAEKVERGIAQLSDKVMDSAGRFRTASIKDKLNGAGNERLQEMLGSGLDYNMPNIIDKAVIQMANLVSAATVKIKFPGGKMVLQSSYGIDLPSEITPEQEKFWSNYGKEEIAKLTEQSRRLEYKEDANGRWHAEVLLPMAYKDKANPGDFVLPDGMGFRIPSTELHSSLPLKIAGFYDDKGSNVVIAPAELVAQHGSDFDVDSLYVITREQAGRTIETTNVTFTKGVPVGYYKVNDKYEFNAVRFRNELDEARKDAAEDKKTLRAIEKLHDQFLNNQITEAFLDTISHPENKQRMLTPISTEVISKSFKELGVKTGNSVNISRLLDNLQVFNSNFQGASLVGIFANGMKALSYMSRAGVRTEAGVDAYPQLSSEKLHVQFGGRTYSEFTEVDHTGGNLWEELDALVNTSVDNVKEQKLFHMNATDRTGPAYVAAKAIGMPLTEAMRMMLQPVVKRYAAIEGGRGSVMPNLKVSILEHARGLDLIGADQGYDILREIMKEHGGPEILTEEALNKAIKSDGLGSDVKAFVLQFQTLEQFEKIAKMGDDLTTFSRAISILQDMPVFYKDIASKTEQWDKLGTVTDGKLTTAEDYSFNLDSLMEAQPNIAEAYKAFGWLKQGIDKSAIKHFPEVQALADALADSLKVRLVFDRAANKEALKNEIISYLVSSYYADGMAGQPAVTVFRKKGNDIILTGRAAWSQTFADTVAEHLKADRKLPSAEQNPFLKRLAVVESKYGIKSLQFANSSNPDALEALEMQEGFAAMESDSLKQDFVKYAVLNFGMSFGVKNYSMFIPSELLKPVSDYISRDIKKMVQESTLDSEGKLIAGPLKNIIDNLSIRLAVNNVEKLPFISPKKIEAVQTKDSNGKPMTVNIDNQIIPVQSGYNGDYYWHRAYENPMEGERRKYKEDDLPKFFRKRDANQREAAYMRVNELNNDMVYYQKIGFKNYAGGYDAYMQAIKGGYNSEEYFGNGLIPVPVSNVLVGKYEVRNDHVVPGARVIVYPYSNDTREQGLVGIVDTATPSPKDPSKTVFTLRTETLPKESTPENHHMVDMSYNVAARFGLSIDTSRELPSGVKGMIADGVVYLNPKLITSDTVFHEVAHPMVAAIQAQNPKWYGSLVTELKESAEGKRILNKVKAKYPELTAAGQEVESLVTAIGLEAARQLEDGSFRPLVRRLMRNVGNLVKDVISQLRTTGTISLKTLGAEDMNKLTIGDIAGILAAPAGAKLNIDLSSVKDTPQFSKDLGDEKPSDSVMNTILEKADKIVDPATDENGQEGDTYTVDGKQLTRVSRFMDKFTFREKTAPVGPDGKPLSTIDAIANREADRMFKNVVPGGKLIIDGIEQTKEEYRDSKAKIQNQAIIKGNIIHAKIQRYLAVLQGNVGKVNELDNLITELSSKADKLTTAYDWVTTKAVFSKLMENAGINISTKVPEPMRDKIYSEVKVASDLLGAGKIDLLAEKADGRLRIADFKTGSRLKDKYSASILKYGVQENRITDNPLDRAKLQVMTYALIIKAENPAAKFDGLVVMHLPNEFEATQQRNALAVEVPDYLRMMEQYFRNEEPAVYRQLLERSPKIFDAREYNAPVNPDFVQDVLNSNGASESESLEKARLDLQKLVLSVEMRKAENMGDNWSKEEIKLREKLIRKIAEANTYIPVDFTGALDSKNEISMMTRWLGNVNDTHNPYVQNFAQQLATDRAAAEKELDAKKLKFKTLAQAVVTERTGKRNVLVNSLKWIDKEKVYSNLWNESRTTDPDTGTEYLRRGLTTESDAKWATLSPAEQALSQYMRKEMKDIFNQVMITGKEAVVGKDEKGKPMTKLDLYNKSHRGANFKYNDDFVPRIAITEEEVVQRAVKRGFSAVGTLAKDWFLRHTTDYFENNIEGYNQKDYGLPVRFLGNSNTYVSPESYSTDLQLAFEKYMEQMVNKKHLDKTWMYGQAVKGMLEIRSDENGNPAFGNTTKFLDFHMNNILIGDRLERSGKGLTRHGFTAGRINGEEYNVSTVKVYRTLKSGTAAGLLWLQPVRSLKNALQATYMNAKEAGINSLGLKFGGLTADQADLTYTNNANSYKEAVASQFNLIQGKGKGDFLHTLATHLRLYPEMAEAGGAKGESITRGATLLDTSNFGYLYQMPEEITSVQYALNYLKSLEVKSGPYKGKSMYDMYKNAFKVNDQGFGYFELPADFKRGKIERPDGSFDDLAGLHPLEVRMLQRGIQKIKGGYKPDEKTAIQGTLLGDAFLMFRRWMPSLLVGQFKSKYTDASTGKFLLQTDNDGNLKQRDGEDVYEWRARVVEGRYKVVYGLFMNMVGLNKYSGYAWSDLSGEQRKAAIDLAISFGTWVSMLGFTAGALGDRDDKDSLKMLAQDMGKRYTEPWNLPALVDGAVQPPAVVKKSLDIYKGVMNLLGASYAAATGGDKKDIYTNRGDIKGANLLMKNTPFVSSYYELNRFSEETDEGSVWEAISPF